MGAAEGPQEGAGPPVQSVEQLAEDVSRFLTARPVLAGPDSRRYRARKFVVRHRAAVAAGALVTLSLVVGLGATLWQAQKAEAQRVRAELRFQNARRLANSMVFELNDAIEAGGTSARALLLTRASEQLDALARDVPDDPVLAEELAESYHRLGNVQGRTGFANLGDRKSALASHRKGLALRTTIAERTPRDLDARFRLGEPDGRDGGGRRGGPVVRTCTGGASDRGLAGRGPPRGHPLPAAARGCALPAGLAASRSWEIRCRRCKASSAPPRFFRPCTRPIPATPTSGGCSRSVTNGSGRF